MSLVQTRKKMEQYMPLVALFVFIFIAGIFLSFQFGGGDVQSAGPNAGLFARINGHEVPMAQFERNLDQTREQFRMFSASSGQSPTLTQQMDYPRYAYERLLEEYAQAEAARASGVDVSRSEAEAEVRKQVEERLKVIGEGATPQELTEYRNALLAGVDVEAQRRQIMAQKLRDKLAKDARPVETKVAHILIKTDNRSDAMAQKLAEDLARRARSGADFAKLAQEHSEDPGSKVSGGVVGWASAMPPPPPTDPKAKQDPEAATSFVPEFTAAALRLRPGQVSDPVRSQFGYHVIKVLEEREYKPTEPEAQKDPKKRQEAIDSYKTAVGNQIATGLFNEYKSRAQVEPHSAWLRGYLAEEQANRATATAVKDGKAPTEAEKLAPAIAAYEEALQKNEPVASPALAYKLVQLYQRTNQDQKALEVLEKWAKRSGDAEMFFAQGETLEKLKRKTDALAAYQQAMENAWNNPSVLGRLADRFKELGRSDLAQQARAKQNTQLARQAEEQKRRDEEFRKMMAAQAAENKAQAAKKEEGDVVSEVTVKTGDIDPKTGKPKIVSVEHSNPQKDGKSEPKAGEESDAKEPAPAKP